MRGRHAHTLYLPTSSRRSRSYRHIRHASVNAIHTIMAFDLDGRILRGFILLHGPRLEIHARFHSLRNLVRPRNRVHRDHRMVLVQTVARLCSNTWNGPDNRRSGGDTSVFQ